MLNVRSYRLAVIFLLAIFVLSIGILMLSPLKIEVCDKDAANAQDNCPAYNVVLVARWKIGEVLSDSTFVTALGTIAIAIFTAILGSFTISLARSTRVAAEAARDSADASLRLQRPYLLISGMEIRERRDLPQPAILCEYLIENYGKSPAILAFSCVDARCLQGLPDIPPYKNLRTWRDKLIYPQRPLGKKESLFCITPPDDGQFLDAELEGYELFMFGYFIFYDVFGKRRRTGFCYRIRRNPTSVMRVRHPAYDYDTEEQA